MKIAVIAVLYNQKLTAGNTWNTLLRPVLHRAQIILADNSDDRQLREENRKAAETCGAVYIDMEENRGLSAAYNRAIGVIAGGTDSRNEDRAGGKTEETDSAEKYGSRDEWIVTADQDTCFPENYLQILEETAGQTKCDVLVPVVRAGQKQLSPCRRKGARFVPYEQEKLSEKELQEAFFINTGLAFRKSIFEDPSVRYEEKLFLDFADFDFINRLRTEKKVRFGLLPHVVLQQEFSGTEARTAEQDLERFRHFAGDGRLFYERWYDKKTAERAVRIRALRLAAKHHDTRFLKKI